MEKIVITKPVHGICHMIVCVAPEVQDAEILEHCNRFNPAGIIQGWSAVIRKDDKQPQRNPLQCSDHKERTHLMVEC